MTPFLSCVCPTYKRPELLSNALACFLHQDYPRDRCELLIMDDAEQFEPQHGDNWRLVTASPRIPSLWDKYNRMIAMTRGQIIVIWEDDDIYLPHHLSSIATAFSKYRECREGMKGCPPFPHQFLVPGRILTNCGLPRGEVKEEPQLTGHHGSWAFTRSLFIKSGGYPTQSGLLGGDLELGRKMRTTGRLVKYAETPTYVYRWNPAAHYHGSMKGPKGFQQLWEELEKRPAPFVGELVPRLDAETETILSRM